MPAKAGIQTWPLLRRSWIPAYAGMTKAIPRGAEMELTNQELAT